MSHEKKIIVKQNHQNAFLSLVRAGLWETEARLSPSECLDLQEVYNIAKGQSVVGLVTAGLEHVVGVTVSKEQALPFFGTVLEMENRNGRMNRYIAGLMEHLRHEGISALLVKGQGVAQCYERPLWRSAGDIDLLLDSDNYDRAAVFLPTLAQRVEENITKIKHFRMQLDVWEVELHGTLHCGLSRRIDRVIDAILEDTFNRHLFRVWRDGETDIYLPAPVEDVVFVFTHILHHFFGCGVGLRQICDWCRLIWTFREDLDVVQLATWLREMGLTGVWRVFAALAVEQLGMPKEGMPFYSPGSKWSRKGRKVLRVVLASGNFGQNRDRSYIHRHRFHIRKFVSFWQRTREYSQIFPIFPILTIRSWSCMLATGVSSLLRLRRD
jgi:hypothetical protein